MLRRASYSNAILVVHGPLFQKKKTNPILYRRSKMKQRDKQGKCMGLSHPLFYQCTSIKFKTFLHKMSE